jgi:hypothetical protein
MLPVDFNKAAATLVSTEGDSAVVKMTPPEGCKNPEGTACETKDLKMVKVEGKWIPADMAANWAAGIADAKAKVAMMDPSQIAAQKPQIMAMMAMVDGALTQIANASTQEEFNAAIGGIMGMVAGSAGG